MLRIRRFLEQYGIHSFLLPVFFALHSYIQYYGLISGKTAIHVLIEIELIFLLFFLVVLSLNRHINKSLAIITLVGFVYLYYGVIKDFLSDTLRVTFLAKYTILL